jgi:branched-chain amino acid transport system permease protein
MIFRVSKQVSFAYGQTGMIAALGSWFLISQSGAPEWMAIAAGLVAAMAISAGTEVFIVRRVAKIRPSFDLIVTLGLFLALTSAAEQLFGTESHAYTPLLADGGWTLAGVYINRSDPLALTISAMVVLGTFLTLRRTSLGISVRACAEDTTVAQSFGVNVAFVRTGIWVFGGLVAGMASVLFASRLFVDTNFMVPILINGFVAAMVGGLERFWAPLAVALFLGAYEAIIGLLFGSTASIPAIFVALILALTLAPSRWIADERARP